MSIISFANLLRFDGGYAPTVGHSGSGSSTALLQTSNLALKNLSRPFRINFTYSSSGAYTTVSSIYEGDRPAGRYVFGVLNHSLRPTDKIGFRLLTGSTILTVARQEALGFPQNWLHPHYFCVVDVPATFWTVEFQFECLSSHIFDVGGLFMAQVFTPAVGSQMMLDSFKLGFEDKSRRIITEDETPYFIESRTRRVLSFTHTGLSEAEANSLTNGSSVMTIQREIGKRQPIIVLPYVPTNFADAAQRLKMLKLGMYGRFRNLGTISQISRDASGPRFQWSDAQFVEGG